MRVALLDPPSFTVPYDHELASALARRGHDVTLLASPFAFGNVPEPAGYRREEVFLPLSSRLVRRAPRSRLRHLLKGLEYAPSAARLVRRVRALRPDVVHVQWLGAARLDIHWLRRLVGRYPLVLTAHDVVPRQERNMQAWGEVLAGADRVVVHSNRARERLVALGVAPERLVRIPHAVFDAAAPERPERPSGATLLFFGLIREYKGLAELIEALPAIARRIPGARLVVAGDPVDPVEPLRRRASELGVVDRIDWRLGFLADEEIAPLMRDSTLVVLPYRQIDSSGVLATALGHGRPVVVSDVGALPDPVHDFGAGRVVPPNDPGSLAEACAELLADGTALDRAFEGAQAARRTLTWEAAAAEHERVYEEVAR
ncbi:MAG: glycosyltransferase family 4 protein [Thermoleophilia bacterium]|nr:glycosyltransferase family 4 protein [Thermoleophilia bacterium]